jgi:hypothetical protein
MSLDPYAPPKDDPSRAHGPVPAADGTVRRVTEAEAAAIARRLKQLNQRSIALIGPGLILQIIGALIANDVLGPSLRLVGVVLMTIGLTFYARVRGRSPWFGLLGILSCVGAAVVSRLPKNCAHCGAAVGASPECRTCGAPVLG